MSPGESDDDGTGNFSRRQSSDRHEPEDANHRLEAHEVTEADQRCLIVDDDSGVPECDESEEQADACRHAQFQVVRYCIDEPLPDREHAEGHKDDAGNEDGPQRSLPRVSHAQYDTEVKNAFCPMPGAWAIG